MEHTCLWVKFTIKYQNDWKTSNEKHNSCWKRFSFYPWGPVFLTQNNSEGMSQIVLVLLQWTVFWSAWLEQNWLVVPIELVSVAYFPWRVVVTDKVYLLLLGLFQVQNLWPCSLLLRWHSSVVEVVQLQACFGENDDNIHFNLFFFFNIPWQFIWKMDVEGKLHIQISLKYYPA